MSIPPPQSLVRARNASGRTVGISLSMCCRLVPHVFKLAPTKQPWMLATFGWWCACWCVAFDSDTRTKLTCCWVTSKREWTGHEKDETMVKRLGFRDFRWLLRRDRRSALPRLRCLPPPNKTRAGYSGQQAESRGTPVPHTFWSFGRPSVQLFRCR